MADTRRVAAYSAVALACYALFVAIWIAVVRHAPATAPSRQADYAVFWSASYVMLHGSPWQAYDLPTFSRLAAELFPQFRREDLVAWLYPPTNLLLVTPLALLPYAVGYPLFVAFGIVVFGFAAARVSKPARSPACGASARSRCSPPVRVRHRDVRAERVPHRVVRGAGRLLGRPSADVGRPLHRPAVGEAADGAAVPVRAGRHARAHGRVGRAHHRRVHRIEHPDLRRRIATPVRRRHGARTLLLEQGIVFWLASPAPFAALRLAGLPPGAAYAAQACIAALAIAAACIVWTRSRDVRLRAAVLAVATLAANPYVWHYELAWLGIAIACLLAIGWQDGWLRGEQTAIALMCCCRPSNT